MSASLTRAQQGGLLWSAMEKRFEDHGGPSLHSPHLVLAALYISVSESLNVTSKVTYINFWLLFNLIFPFIIVLLHSYIQHQRTMMAEAATPTKKKKGQCCWPGAAVKAMVCLFIVKVVVPLAGVVFMATYWIIGLYYLAPLVLNSIPRN